MLTEWPFSLGYFTQPKMKFNSLNGQTAVKRERFRLCFSMSTSAFLADSINQINKICRIHFKRQIKHFRCIFFSFVDRNVEFNKACSAF